MKLNVTAFLIKEGIDKEDAFSIKGHKHHHSFQRDGTDYDFYWKTSNSSPAWAELFQDVAEVDHEKIRARGAQGLLIFEQSERIFCITFGHARHFLNPLAIERNFGLKAALGLSNPAQIKSIDKTNLDRNPIKSRTQAARNSAITAFDFKFDWEIMKSLTGEVEDPVGEYKEIITGSDSVSLYTDVTIGSLKQTTQRLLDGYQSDAYKEKYPWIDHIVPLRDSALTSELDEILLEKIVNEDIDNVWIAPPELIDYENFSGFSYRRRRASAKASQPLSPELDLATCLKEKKFDKKSTLPQLKTTPIFLYGADDQVVKKWPLYRCLNCELEHVGLLYLLNEGGWYLINQDFAAAVNDYFMSCPEADFDLPPYNGLNEAEYLETVADSDTFFLLDRKLVLPEGATSRIEFCDLITNEHTLIHVKKYSGSSTLSHLFSQGYVSAESLLRSPNLVAQVNTYLGELGDYEFEFDQDQLPRPCKIVFAVMQKKAGALDIPFFSKVNFRHFARQLIDMGFRVELKKIDL